MTFVLCLNTSTIQPQALLDKIALASRHGFGAIELWCNDVFEFVERGGRVDDVGKALVDAGLSVPCMIAMKGWGDATDEAYPAALDECRRRMDLAARLGSGLIVATPPRGPGDLPQIARRFGDLLALGRQIGTRPVMEYLGFCQSVWRVDQALRVAMAADEQTSGESPSGLVLDSFHTFRGGSTLDDLRRVPCERIAHVHWDDAPAHPPREQQADPDRVLPGDGILDLASEARLLRQKGYRGAVSLELFNPSLWAIDPDDLLRRGIERMHQTLET